MPARRRSRRVERLRLGLGVAGAVIARPLPAIVGGVERDQVDAISRLYERYARAVHGYALRRSDRDTADEVTAQVFLVAWRRRATLPDDTLPWLYGVARRALADQRRGTTRRRRLHERLRSEAVERSPRLELPDRGLACALGRLSDHDREALLLCYWEDLGPAQIARVLGCSRAAAAVRLHRARGRLRKQLEAQHGQRPEGEQHGGSCAVKAESA
jgi:RNA polymerase sigma-70 factor, ECF subfamily